MVFLSSFIDFSSKFILILLHFFSATFLSERLYVGNDQRAGTAAHELMAHWNRITHRTNKANGKRV